MACHHTGPLQARRDLAPPPEERQNRGVCHLEEPHGDCSVTSHATLGPVHCLSETGGVDGDVTVQYHQYRPSCCMDCSRAEVNLAALGQNADSSLFIGMQTEETAAAMARSWLALPEHIKEKGWPQFVEATRRVAFFGR